jgi:hypothetical protein
VSTRRTPSPGAAGLGVALAVLVLGTAGLILARAPAEHAAVRSKSDSVAAHRVLEGRRRFARTTSRAALARVAENARRTLDRAPLESGALSLYAQSLPGLDRQQADAMVILAARLSRRNDVADRWLFERGLEAGDFRGAFLHADALMRRQNTDARVNVVRRMFPHLRNPAAFSALTDRLAMSPDWRPIFFEQLIALSPEATEAFPLLQALRASGSPPKQAELSAYLRRLVAERRYRDAHAAWAALAPNPAQVQSALLFDGEFRGDQPTPPFGWSLDSASGGFGEFLESDDGSGKALRVTYDRRATQWLVQQMLVLPPGDSYRLRGRARALSEFEPIDMVWTLSCIGNPEPLARLPVPMTDGGWRTFATTFVVPPDRCEGQALVLQGIPDGGPRTEVWFDGLTIDRGESHAD